MSGIMIKGGVHAYELDSVFQEHLEQLSLPKFEAGGSCGYVRANAWTIGADEEPGVLNEEGVTWRDQTRRVPASVIAARVADTVQERLLDGDAMTPPEITDLRVELKRELAKSWPLTPTRTTLWRSDTLLLVKGSASLTLALDFAGMEPPAGTIKPLRLDLPTLQALYKHVVDDAGTEMLLSTASPVVYETINGTHKVNATVAVPDNGTVLSFALDMGEVVLQLTHADLETRIKVVSSSCNMDVFLALLDLLAFRTKYIQEQ